MLKAAAVSLAVFGASFAWLMGGMLTAGSAHADGPLGGSLLSGAAAEPSGLGSLVGGAAGTLAEVTDTLAAPPPGPPASSKQAEPPPASIATTADSVLDSLLESPVSEPKPSTPILDEPLVPLADAAEPVPGQPGTALVQLIAPAPESVAGLLGSVAPVLTSELQRVADLAGPTLIALTPIIGDLGSPLGAIVDPLAEGLAPITGSLGVVLAPVTGPLASVLAPVTTPLAPVLGPIVGPLAPVFAPLSGPFAPVLAPMTNPLGPGIAPIAPVIPAAQPPITGPAVPPPSPGQPNITPRPAKPSDAPPAEAPGVPAASTTNPPVPASVQPRVPALSEPTVVRDLFIDLAGPAAAEPNLTFATLASPRVGGTTAQFSTTTRSGSFSTDARASTGPFAPAFVASASNALAFSSTSAGFFAALAATLAAGALLAVWRRVGLEWLVPPSLAFAPEVPPA